MVGMYFLIAINTILVYTINKKFSFTFLGKYKLYTYKYLKKKKNLKYFYHINNST